MIQRQIIYFSIATIFGFFNVGCFDRNDYDVLALVEFYHENEDYKKALSLLRKEIKSNATTAMYIKRFRIHQELGDYDNARDDLFNVIDLAQRNYYLSNEGDDLLIVATALLLVGDEERAVGLFDLIKERHPNLSGTIENHDQLAIKKIKASGLLIFQN